MYLILSVCYEANALLNLGEFKKKVKTGVLEALWMEILKNVNGGNGATRIERVKQ